MPKGLEGDPVLAEFGMPNAGMTVDVGEEEAEESPQEEVVEAATEPAETEEAEAEAAPEAEAAEKTTLQELSEAIEPQDDNRLAELEKQNAKLQGMLEAMVRQSDSKVLEQPQAEDRPEDKLEPYDLTSPAIVGALKDAMDDPEEFSRRVAGLIDAQAKRLVEIESKRVQDDLSSFKSDATSLRAAQAAENRLQSTLDVLAEHGGKTGKEIVQQFRQAGDQRADTYIGRFLQQNPELLLVKNDNALALALQGAVNYLDKAVEMKRQNVTPGVETAGVSGRPSRRSEVNKTQPSDEELDDEDRLLDEMMNFHRVPKEDELLQELLNPKFE